MAFVLLAKNQKIIIGYKNPICNNHKNKNYVRPMGINLTRNMQDLHEKRIKFYQRTWKNIYKWGDIVCSIEKNL